MAKIDDMITCPQCKCEAKESRVYPHICWACALERDIFKPSKTESEADCE